MRDARAGWTDGFGRPVEGLGRLELGALLGHPMRQRPTTARFVADRQPAQAGMLGRWDNTAAVPGRADDRPARSVAGRRSPLDA